ncbi:MAG: hypothetical protein AAGE52_39530 [Myxococcota bacterium]
MQPTIERFRSPLEVGTTAYQVPPTFYYEIFDQNGKRHFVVVTLGAGEHISGAHPYRQDREHWFRHKDYNAAAFKNATELRLMKIKTGYPDVKTHLLANEQDLTLQAVARYSLGTTDWVKTSNEPFPTLGGDSTVLKGTSNVASPGNWRVAFDIHQGTLRRVIWSSTTPSTPALFVNSGDPEVKFAPDTQLSGTFHFHDEKVCVV